MITQLMDLPKWSGSAKIRAELETIIEEEGPREYARVSTDDEQSGCAIVMGHREVKIRLAGQMAIKLFRNWRVDKRIIMTDSLSNIVTQEEIFTKGTGKKMILKDLMAEEGSNLKLMWVPAHVDIKDN
jgi:hypothetical protein